MARRKVPEPAHTAVVESPETQGSARAELLTMLEHGRELLAREFSLPMQLEEARRERKAWRDHTEALLWRVFSDESVVAEFAETPAARYSDRPSVVEDFEEFRDSTQTYVARLQTIAGRLGLGVEIDRIGPGTRAGQGRPPAKALSNGARHRPAHAEMPDAALRAGSSAEPVNGVWRPERNRDDIKDSSVVPPERRTPVNGWPRAHEASEAPDVPAARPHAVGRAPGDQSGMVFIVDGGEPGTGETVAALAEELGLSAEFGAEFGRTSIEEVESHAGAAFAVVLLTRDLGGSAEDAPPGQRGPGARQSFELGFLVGRLGRKKVCALKEPGVASPTDWGGIVFIDVDPYGAWRYKLAKEMRNAGLSVDLNRLA